MTTTKSVILLTCFLALVGQQGFAQSGSPQPAADHSVADQFHARGAKKLGLAEAISLAVANNPLVLQSLSDVSSAEAATGQAESDYYPSVTGSASYTRVEPNQSFTFPGLGTFSLSQENNWDFHVGLAQVLYSAGRRSASVKLAEAGTTAARIGVEKAKMSLAYQTARAFYTVLFLQQQLQSLNQQLSDLQQHLSSIQKKRETGSATQYDVLSTQVQVASMQNDIIDAQNQEQKQLITLKQLIGLAPLTRVELIGSFAVSGAGGVGGAQGTDGSTTAGSSTKADGALAAGDSEAVESYLSQALTNRPQIKQALNAEDRARLSLQLARVEGLPTVSADAQTGFKNGMLPDESSLTFNWTAGVAVSVPIFNGFDVTNKIRQAQSKLKATQQNTAAVRRTVTTEVLQAYQDLSASREEVKNSLVQLEQAQAALSQAKVQYDLGVITNVEYLDAESSFEQAHFTNLSSVYHEVMSGFALKQAVGQQIWSGVAR